MNSRNHQPSKPWRILIGIASVAFIIFMWVKKDIVAIYSTMPAEQVVPLIITTLTVSLLKVGVLAGAILLFKWIIGKVSR